MDVKSLQLVSLTEINVAKRSTTNLAAETVLVTNTQLHTTHLQMYNVQLVKTEIPNDCTGATINP